jgi:Glyoxalase-like domain
MPYELDHLYILATPGAPEGQRLVDLGITEGSPNVHPGQGTANRRFYFHNAMLELIYVTDETEARSALVAPTRLWERSRWRQTAACPFGLCLHPAGDEPPPFPTFDYRPPYLPGGGAIPIAKGTMAIEPMLFINPWGQRPEAFPPDQRQPLDHPLGVREVTGVHIVSAGCELPTDSLDTVRRLGIATFSQGDGHLLELTFEGGTRGGSADLRPDLPLVLHW